MSHYIGPLTTNAGTADYLARTIVRHTDFIGPCADCGRPTAATVNGAPRHVCCATQVAQGHLGACDPCEASNAELRRQRGDDRGPDKRRRP